MVCRQVQSAFAAPHAHNPHNARIASIDDSERRMNEFPQGVLTEFRDHAPHVGMIRQMLDAGDDVADKPDTHIPRALLGIPRSDVFEVTQRGLGETNLRRHVLLDAKP